MTGRRGIGGLRAGLAGLLVAVSGVAGAQALPAAVGPGTSVRIGGGISATQVDYGQRYMAGGHSWVDLNPVWRLGIEGEATWLRYNSDQGAKQTTYLIGPRIALMETRRYEPYVKAMVGAGIFQFPFGYARGTYFVVAGAAGVDMRLGRNFHVRAVEVEYQNWPQFTFGPLHPYGVSTGISYTLFHGSREPNGLHR